MVGTHGYKVHLEAVTPYPICMHGLHAGASRMSGILWAGEGVYPAPPVAEWGYARAVSAPCRILALPAPRVYVPGECGNGGEQPESNAVVVVLCVCVALQVILLRRPTCALHTVRGGTSG